MAEDRWGYLWFEDARVVQERLRLLLLPLMSLLPIINDQMAESDFEEIAKAAALGIEVLEIAAEKTDAKFLSHIFGCGRLAQHAQEITVNRAVIAEHQLLAGPDGRLPLALVGCQPDCEPGLDAAQAVVEFIRLHGPSLPKAEGAALIVLDKSDK